MSRYPTTSTVYQLHFIFADIFETKSLFLWETGDNVHLLLETEICMKLFLLLLFLLLSMKYSRYWSRFKIYKFTKNLRLLTTTDSSPQAEEFRSQQQEYLNMLNIIGEGTDPGSHSNSHSKIWKVMEVELLRFLL
jgi:hypothetical protein